MATDHAFIVFDSSVTLSMLAKRVLPQYSVSFDASLDYAAELAIGDDSCACVTISHSYVTWPEISKKKLIIEGGNLTDEMVVFAMEVSIRKEC